MIKQIETYKLVPHPNNPRINLGDLTELTESIKNSGILQNLTVVPSDTVDVYTVVIGHRRLAAAMQAGVLTVPCVVAEMDEQTQQATMLLENMQRTELTPYEQAQGMQMCLDLGLSEKDIATKTGFSKATVRRRIKLLELDQEKVKKAQGSIEDYLKLEFIEDIEVKNNLLQYIGTNNFDLEVEKAIQLQQQSEPGGVVDKDQPIDKVIDKKALHQKLRISFMKEVFKRKISKEELAYIVGVTNNLLTHHSFKLQANRNIFNEIANPTNLSDQELEERMQKHKVNFLVVSLYSIIENMEDIKMIYEYLAAFSYVLSDEEKEGLTNA